MEEWRGVQDFGSGYYEVSNKGRYRSLDRYVKSGRGNGTRLLKGRINKLHYRGRYLFASITVERECRSIYIHRLVARAFPEICGEWFEGCEVDHINTDTSDNRAENLRVVTRTENTNNPLTKKHLREATTKWLKDKGHPLKGTHLTEETKEKIRKANAKFTKEEIKQHKKDYVEKNREHYTEYWRNYYYAVKKPKIETAKNK